MREVAGRRGAGGAHHRDRTGDRAASASNGEL